MKRLTLILAFALCVIVVPGPCLYAQGCGANIISGATSGFLDPNSDGFITSSGSGFSACPTYVDEMTEFEVLTNPSGCATCQVDWSPLPVGQEWIGDLWAGGSSCGNTEITLDDSSGTYGYFTIIDPDGTCNNGDEMLIFRIRCDASVSGSFSYCVLISSDGLLGPDDPDGIVCASKVANAGFEYEIVANPANGQNVEVRNIDGVAASYGTDVAHSNSVPSASYSNTTHYNQSEACRSICAACGTAGAVYHTFGIKLTDIGFNCSNFENLQFAGMTSSSGNGSLSAGNSVSDVGGAADIDCPGMDTLLPCMCCSLCAEPTSDYYCGASGQAFNACMMGCVTSCIAETNDILPVELVNFYGTIKEDNIEVKWSTATETNSDYFELTRSTNGYNFEVLGLVPAAGNSNSIQKYSYIDVSPHDGLNYYRLRQVDITGKSNYAGVIVLNTEHDFMMSVQTLVTDELNIKLFNDDRDIDLRIFDMQGHVLDQKHIDRNRNSSVYTFDASDYSQGVYIVEARNMSMVKQYKFIKMN